jgi:hypothetical protein
MNADAPENAEELIGTLPLSALMARPSKSALASKRKEILRDLALSPLERVKRALSLGAGLRKVAEAHGHRNDT